jgi:hypothetical protein
MSPGLLDLGKSLLSAGKIALLQGLGRHNCVYRNTFKCSKINGPRIQPFA